MEQHMFPYSSFGLEEGVYLNQLIRDHSFSYKLQSNLF